MLLGFILVFLAGLTWNAEGIGVSYCAKRNISFDLVQGWLFLICLLASIVLSICAGDFTNHTPDVLLRTSICMFLAGIAVFFTFVMAGKAMEKGPNGLVWGIMQAGMIGSFLLGVFAFGEKPSMIRVAGLFLIVAGVFGMGLGKPSSGKRVATKDWLPPSLGAFLMVAITHSLCAYPSFVPELSKTSAMFRSIGLFGGGLLTFAIYSLPKQLHQRQFVSKSILVIVAVLVVEKMLANYLLFYPGLDRLAAHHAGGLGYPVAIGVCVGGFSLYSLTVLKEKFSRTGLVSLCAVLLGIVLISLV